MKKIRFLKIIFFLIFLSFAFSARAANRLSVVINEIAWMGTIEGYQYEWLELYNNSNQKIDIANWKIENAEPKNQDLEIPEGKILPEDYFLICKKKVEKCDLEIKTLSLANNYKENGQLILKDKNGNIVDQTPKPASSRWPAGDNKTKKTMERISRTRPGSDSLSWRTSKTPGGSPGSANIISTQVQKNGRAKQSGKIKKPVSKNGVRRTEGNVKSEKKLAAASEPLKSPSVFLVALSLAVFSGFIILFLKKNLKDLPHQKK